MQTAIDRIMQTYDLLMNRTAAASAEARENPLAIPCTSVGPSTATSGGAWPGANSSSALTTRGERPCSWT